MKTASITRRLCFISAPARHAGACSRKGKMTTIHATIVHNSSITARYLLQISHELADTHSRCESNISKYHLSVYRFYDLIRERVWTSFNHPGFSLPQDEVSLSIEKRAFSGDLSPQILGVLCSFQTTRRPGMTSRLSFAL